MSADGDEADDTLLCCAACGIAEVDDIKLKKCTACNFVRYCSVECQKNHRKQHKKVCKKRAAELRDELLFKQPESSHYGDCPICCLPLSLDEGKSAMTSCCCVFICDGCSYANQMEDAQSNREPKCPFCRAPHVTSQAEAERNLRKRIEAGYQFAIREKGCQGRAEKNYSVALEFLTKAANMDKGDAVAHYHLGNMYCNGEEVEKDMKKAVYHWEEAAIGGHPEARFNLGATDGKNGEFERAVKHFIIAASQGCDKSLEEVKELYRLDIVTKAELATALRAHQAAVDSTKSPQREKAEQATRGVNCLRCF